MKGRKTKYGVAVLAACAVAAIAVPVVVQATTANAVGVLVKSNLKVNTVDTLSGTVGGAPVTVTCTGSATSFTLSAAGPALGPWTLTTPTFTGCTDSFGGTDTVTTNSDNGSWALAYVPSGSSTIDAIRLTIPKAGAVVNSSVVPACHITLAPSAAKTIQGAYDGKGSLKFTNRSIPTATDDGCPGGAATGTGSFSTALKSGSSGSPGYVIAPALLPLTGP